MFLAGDVAGRRTKHVPIVSKARKLSLSRPAESVFNGRTSTAFPTSAPPRRPIVLPQLRLRHDREIFSTDVSPAEFAATSTHTDVKVLQQRLHSRTSPRHSHQAGAPRGHLSSDERCSRPGSFYMLTKCFIRYKNVYFFIFTGSTAGFYKVTLIQQIKRLNLYKTLNTKILSCLKI